MPESEVIAHEQVPFALESWFLSRRVASLWHTELRNKEKLKADAGSRRYSLEKFQRDFEDAESIIQRCPPPRAPKFVVGPEAYPSVPVDWKELLRRCFDSHRIDATYVINWIHMGAPSPILSAPFTSPRLASASALRQALTRCKSLAHTWAATIYELNVELPSLNTVPYIQHSDTILTDVELDSRFKEPYCLTTRTVALRSEIDMQGLSKTEIVINEDPLYPGDSASQQGDAGDDQGMTNDTQNLSNFRVLPWLFARHVIPLSWHTSGPGSLHIPLNTVLHPRKIDVGVGSAAILPGTDFSQLIQDAFNEESPACESIYLYHTNVEVNTMRNVLIDIIHGWVNDNDPFNADIRFGVELSNSLIDEAMQADSLYCRRMLSPQGSHDQLLKKQYRDLWYSYDQGEVHDNRLKDLVMPLQISERLHDYRISQVAKAIFNEAMQEPDTVVCDGVLSQVASFEAGDFDTPSQFSVICQLAEAHNLFVKHTSTSDKARVTLHLPLLVIVKEMYNFEQNADAHDTCRVSVASATAFLRCLGIRGWPVFGLVIDDDGDSSLRASLLYAWASLETDDPQGLDLMYIKHGCLHTFVNSSQDDLRQLKEVLEDLKASVSAKLTHIRSTIKEFARTATKETIPWTSLSQSDVKRNLESSLGSNAVAYIKMRRERLETYDGEDRDRKYWSLEAVCRALGA